MSPQAHPADKQADDRQAATAAAAPLQFSDGTVYQMSPLSDKDIAELDAWVQSRVIQMARASLLKDAPQSERDETLRIAMQTASSITWLSGQGAQILATVPGWTRLVWQAIKRNHPDVTEEELSAQMFSAENIREVNRVFTEQNVVKEPAKEPAKKKGPKETRKGRKRKMKKKTKKGRRGGKSTGR